MLILCETFLKKMFQSVESLCAFDVRLSRKNRLRTNPQKFIKNYASSPAARSFNTCPKIVKNKLKKNRIVLHKSLFSVIKILI